MGAERASRSWKTVSQTDPDNRDAQDKALEEVAKSQQPPAYEEPDDVQASDREPSVSL